MRRYPKYKVAAAHVAPVLGDIGQTVDKVCHVIRDASSRGVKLLAFSEAFIPGYPTWCRVTAPINSHGLFSYLAANAIYVDGPEMDQIRSTAAQHDIFVSIGFSEATSASVGCIWNSNIFISNTGTVLNHHRKLVPTFAEKLVWANGDGAGLRVSDTELGKIGMLICGENTNPLARYCLMAQGEQVHISSYPAVVADRTASGEPGYDLEEAIRIRAAAHSFEAKAFNIVASTPYDDTAKAFLAQYLDDTTMQMLADAPKAVSMVLDPSGKVISDTLCETEGLCVADIDVSKCVEPKRVHDVVGYYNRFDVFDLRVNRTRQVPISFTGQPDFDRTISSSNED